MNRVTFKLLIIIFLSFLSLNSRAITGFGNTSCGTWVENRKNNAAYYEMRFLDGFLLGYAMGSNKDFLRNIDASAVYVWTDNYCKSNPTNGLVRAAIVLKEEMIKKEGLK